MVVPEKGLEPVVALRMEVAVDLLLAIVGFHFTAAEAEMQFQFLAFDLVDQGEV